MTANPSFSILLDSLTKVADETWAVNITDNWLQGRTTYGGLSAALCLRSVVNEHKQLPPLRSAQINFIGPVAGDVKVTTKIMRQGRSVTYISAEMYGEKGLATHAVFCFGATRESRLDGQFTSQPSVPSVEESTNFFSEGFGPSFAQNYDCKLSQGGHPISGSEHSEHFIWVRHKDKGASDMAALLGIADMPPPAVLPMFKEFAPISSMTWMLNFLSEDLTTKDGWWLMRSAAEHSKDGYSSQDMQVWNTDGELIVTSRQSVAVFY
ncbi:thioesterase family protein [Arenicella sp. 4NH20-0111]|uniref:thioesterase family protein n=1 Tax=Arenicella sp. 4NH20-0111 TaxID=3127648 RepID=UPI003107D1CA